MMDLLANIDRALDELDRRGLRRERRTVEDACSTGVTLRGRTVLAFCSNDYLGLAAHPAVVAALEEGARRYGAGSGASHLVSGHSRAHALLEEQLAELVGPYLESPRVLYTSSGYAANLSVLTALAETVGGGGCDIFSESLNHASLIDGARLARAGRDARVIVYPHADCAALDGLLQRSIAALKLIVTDSVFSMDGEIAPLPQLLSLAQRHGAWLVIDDAHGFGVLGRRGAGVLEHFGLRSPHVIYIGTLGKAAGVSGAFVAAHERCVEWLVNRARPYVYSTAAPPALAWALRTAVNIIGGEEGARRREHLHRLTGRLTEAMRLATWRLLPSRTPIQPVVIGDNALTLSASGQLLNEGLWVPAIRPPTVPGGTARLRISLSAAHTIAHVDRLVDALTRLERTCAPGLFTGHSSCRTGAQEA